MVHRDPAAITRDRILLINVDDVRLNLILNGCFWAIVVLTVFSTFPWGLLGLGQRVARLLPAAALAVYAIYEWAMPARMDIRVDLFLLAPMGAIILITWVVRRVFGRKEEDSRAPDGG